MATIKVLVTGGSGLVGQSIRSVVDAENAAHEQWIFVGSKDADLTYVFAGNGDN